MMRNLLLMGAALLSLVTPGNARSLSFVCDGTISYHPLSSYTAIAGKEGKDVCIFVTRSPEGRKILQVCPKGSQCSVEAEVNNTGSENEIYKVVSVHRTGTPALDARAKKEKEAEEKRKWASVLPYAERTTDCVAGQNEVSQDAFDHALEKFCARQRDALVAEYIKQFGPGGRYLYMDYRSNLSKVVEERQKSQQAKYIGIVTVILIALTATPDLPGEKSTRVKITNKNIRSNKSVWRV
jgi:hypothetical protein